MVQEELRNLVVAAGLTPNPTDDTQLAQAVAELIVAHQVTIAAASETVAGILKLASVAKVLEGADPETAVTPAGLAASVALVSIPAATVTDWNTLTGVGKRWFINYNAANTNAPTANAVAYYCENTSYSTTYFVQRAWRNSPTTATQEAWYRICTNGAFSPWQRYANPAVVLGYTAQQYPVPTEATGVSGTVTLDCNAPEYWQALTGATTYANPSNMTKGKRVTLDLYAAAAQTVSWGSLWVDNTYMAKPTSLSAGQRLRMTFDCVWNYSLGALCMQLVGLVPGV
jgi:hypothetical protein